MKNIFYTVLLLSFFFCSGQDKEEIEELINVARKEIVPKEYRYFNLVDSSFVMEFDEFDLNVQDHKAFFDQNPDFKREEFETKALKAVAVNWNDYKIENAVVYTRKDIPRYEWMLEVNRIIPFETPAATIDSLERHKAFNEIIVPVKKHWSQKKIDRVVAAKRKKYYDSIKKEDRTYYRFYTPLFSDDKQYAVVQLDSSGYGKSLIFKKINGTWVKIYIFSTWIS